MSSRNRQEDEKSELKQSWAVTQRKRNFKHRKSERMVWQKESARFVLESIPSLGKYLSGTFQEPGTEKI